MLISHEVGLSTDFRELIEDTGVEGGEVWKLSAISDATAAAHFEIQNGRYGEVLDGDMGDDVEMADG